MSYSTSEEMSPIWTSDQPLGQRAAKRSREDSSGSTGRSRCRECESRKRRGRRQFSGHDHKNRDRHHDKDSIPTTYMEEFLKLIGPNLDNLATADPDGKFCTGIDISKRLPWKIVDWKGDKARYFVGFEDSRQSKKERIINDAFLYKRSSRAHSGTMYAEYYSIKSRRKPDSSKDGRDDPIWAFYEHQEAKKKELEKRRKNKGKKRGKTKLSSSRWRMRMYFTPDAKKSTGGSAPSYRPYIAMIFQDKKAKPDWTPTRRDMVETPAIEPATEARNTAVSLRTIPNPVFSWGDIVTSKEDRTTFTTDCASPPHFEELGEFHTGTFFQDGTTVTSGSDSPQSFLKCASRLHFEETGEFDTATFFQDGNPDTPGFDSPQNSPDCASPLHFEEMGQIDIETWFQDGTALTPGSDSPQSFPNCASPLHFEETREIDTAKHFQDGTAVTPSFDSPQNSPDCASPLHFEETGQIDIETCFDDGTPLSPGSDSLQSFEETGELDVTTLSQACAKLTPDSDETRTLVAELIPNGITPNPTCAALNFDQICPGFEQTAGGILHPLCGTVSSYADEDYRGPRLHNLDCVLKKAVEYSWCVGAHHHWLFSK